ncbi:MAG: hypothetical protein M3511_14940, partial [Deinococcota bacterium]|nr:hypothetical protein [Deinococcota bacterium]
MTTPYESGEALEIDEQALDRAWEAVRCELPGHKATPVQLVDLTGIADRRKAIYASMPPREERLRR